LTPEGQPAFEQIGQRDLVEDLPVILPKVPAMQDDDPPFFGRYGDDDEGRLGVELG
jgi:hypothetical protein